MMGQGDSATDLQQATNTEHRTQNTEHRTQNTNTKHRTQSTEHKNIRTQEHRTQNIAHPNTRTQEHRTQNTELKTQEHRVPQTLIRKRRSIREDPSAPSKPPLGRDQRPGPEGGGGYDVYGVLVF